MSRKMMFLLAAVLLLSGCTGPEPDEHPLDGDGMERPPYLSIDQAEAMRMMERDDGHVIVDVRRQDEYDAGHIPGAILIPNETIGTEKPEELPDLNQIILVYCRSGNRSKQASEKLGKMGYSRVYEFGGINTWTGEIVTENQIQPDPEEDYDAFAKAIQPVATLVLESNGNKLYASFEDNAAAAAFRDALESEAIEIKMHDYGGFEKVGDLPWKLPADDASITTSPGDIILYQGDKITIHYGNNTWEYTKLATIGGKTREALIEALGKGDVTVRFHLEWSE